MADSFEGAPSNPPGDTLAPDQGQGDAFANPTGDGLDKGKGKGPAEGKGTDTAGDALAKAKGKGKDIDYPLATSITIECPICQENMPMATQAGVRWLPCFHVFHRWCIRGYAVSKSKRVSQLPCPVCRMTHTAAYEKMRLIWRELVPTCAGAPPATHSPGSSNDAPTSATHSPGSSATYSPGTVQWQGSQPLETVALKV